MPVQKNLQNNSGLEKNTKDNEAKRLIRKFTVALMPGSAIRLSPPFIPSSLNGYTDRYFKVIEEPHAPTLKLPFTPYLVEVYSIAAEKKQENFYEVYTGGGMEIKLNTIYKIPDNIEQLEITKINS